MSTRLNKLLAMRGIGARRKCDTIIQEGRVRVNGRTVTEPGTPIEEMSDRVEVDGHLLPKAQKLSYFVINKPVGVITTMHDPQGRRTIAELLPRGQRLYPVGRLDADTSGLLLLTNDGELAHKLMHPRYGVEKVYRVRLEQEPGNRQLDRLASGVEFEPGVVSAPARVRRIDPGFDAIMIEVIIHEGRFRQVRRMCEAVGLTVTGLHRVGYGPIRLGPLARGVWRELAETEVERLRATSSRPQRRSGAPGRPARPVRPTRPAPPAAARRENAPPEREEIEETWIAGGGMLPGMDDEDGGAQWPARAGGKRGDDAFRAGKGEGPPRREREMPWHAPEFRRGTQREARRTDKPASRGPAAGRARPAAAAPPRARRDEGDNAPVRRFARDERGVAPARGGGRGERGGAPLRGPIRGPARSAKPAATGRPERGGPPARGSARTFDRVERGGPPARGSARTFERAERGGPPARGSARTFDRAERGGPPARGSARTFDRVERGGPPARGSARTFDRAERGGPPGRKPVRGFERFDRGGAPGRTTGRGAPARGPARGFDPGERGGPPARGPVRRGERGATTPPRAGRSFDRAERGAAPARGPARRALSAGPPRARAGAGDGRASGGERRAFSPRAGRGTGPERTGGGRAKPAASPRGRKSRPESRERRPRKR